MVKSSLIKELLESGAEVYSHALGRVGRVMEVDGAAVLVKSSIRGTNGWTTFEQGDKVYLQIRDNNVFVIKNEF